MQGTKSDALAAAFEAAAKSVIPFPAFLGVLVFQSDRTKKHSAAQSCMGLQ
jgi:hypothetical protein